MDLVKSNALSLLGRLALPAPAASTSAAALDKPTDVEAMMLGLVSIGLCALVVWIVRRATRPAKLRLADTPGRSNSVNPLHILILLVVWQGAGDVAGLLFGRWLRTAPQRLDILTALVRQAVWLGASLVVAAMTFRHGLVRGLGLSLRHWLYDTGRAIFAYLAVVPICFGLFVASKALYGAIYHQEPPDHQMLVALRTVPLPWQAVVVVSAVILAPWSEEVFCRGLVQSMFRRYTASPWAAVGLSSVIFSLLHWDSLAAGGQAGWVQLPAMLALGVVLGYNYERSGRLIAPILIHALFNGVSVVFFLAGG